MRLNIQCNSSQWRRCLVATAVAFSVAAVAVLLYTPRAVSSSPSAIAEPAHCSDVAPVASSPVDLERKNEARGYTTAILGQVEPGGACPDQECSLQVRCISQVGGATEPLSGIEVRLFTPDGKGIGATQTSSALGIVSFHKLQRGKYSIAGRDPNHRWCAIDDADAREQMVHIPSAEAILRFAPLMVAHFRFIGDEVLAIRTGRRPTNFPPALGMLPTEGPPGTYRIYHQPALSSRQLGPSLVEIFAYGKAHGECRFDVPLMRADVADTPLDCDLSRFPTRPATHVTVAVTDLYGRATRLDQVRFESIPAPSFELSRSNTCMLPFGFKYRIVLGDFPIRWSSEDCAYVSTLDPTPTQKSLHVQLPAAFVDKKITVMLNGKPVPQGEPVTVTLVGRWLLPGITAQGCGGLREFPGGDLGILSLPKGQVQLRITIRGNQFEKHIDTSSDSPCVIDCIDPTFTPK